MSPAKVVHCRVCNARISGDDFPGRMAKLRRHYKKHHPEAWKRSIKKGVKARKEKG